MTNELLTKVVKNNELYVIWKTTLLTGENFELHESKFKDHDKEKSRAPKWEGVGGVATPPRILNPLSKFPLIFRKICVEILKSGLFLHKILKSRPFLIALRRIAKKWTFSMRKNS